MDQHDQTLDAGLHTDSADGMRVASELRSIWLQTPVWAKILSITNFSSAALQFISMLLLVPMLRRLVYLSSSDEAGNNIILLMVIVYLLSISFSLIIGWQLWQYALYLGRSTQDDDTASLEVAYYYHYRYFKTLGWMLISLTAFVLIGVTAIMMFNLSRY
ncbi:MAG: hypothetical protein JNK89_09800 [Saprospiraceae bacterium]|nr:hypothetical protein [Saprospiraceae bacterium]